MPILTLDLPQGGYPIRIEAGALTRPEALRGAVEPGRRVAIITNTVVGPLYLAPVAAAFAAHDPLIITLPDGEAQKTLATIDAIVDQLLAARCDRRTMLVALGGGVVGDITGFAAAVYQRGVPFMQIPTTLLAQVDSSVGGKTGVNHARGKNMIGSFYQPISVTIDPDTLKTLPPRERAAGLAEVIKYGAIGDASFFDWLEAHMSRLVALDGDALAVAIERSCRAKAAVVMADEREAGVRALLNFGHTFGHAIEAGAGYGHWLHGEAVGVGMLMAADLSVRLGMLDASAQARLRALVVAAGLPSAAPPLAAGPFLELMAVDKKAEGGRTRFVLLQGLGRALVTAEVPPAALQATLAHFGIR
ncbi:MAG: 3-dehydroquinate synthase [Gammaproteobacteria bacterium]|nr:3-dehydroquinate synthase [Gammaproteobacteria bacterium]